MNTSIRNGHAPFGLEPYLRTRRASASRGVALIFVLWVLALLAVVAATLTVSARSDLALARNLQASARADALAQAGILRAAIGLAATEADHRWLAGQIYALRLGDGAVTMTIENEAGKIDLNHGHDAHLIGLFEGLGVEPNAAAALVDAIVDYRDADNLRRLNGAEDPDYRAAGLRHEAKDAPFVSVSELALVMGMTPELVRRVAPFVTIYSERPKIDLLTAPAEVLLAVPGIFRQDVERLIAARDELQFKGGFPTSLLPVPQTAEKGVFAMPDRAVYTIRSEARTGAGATFVRETVVAVTKDSAKPYRIYTWSRGEIGARDAEAGEPSTLR